MEQVSKTSRALAWWSQRCPVCRCARRNQSGLAFQLVKSFEDLCPFCRAYERVHGRKSHEAVTCEGHSDAIREKA